MCYRCDYPLRHKPTGQPSDVLPVAPFDVVLCETAENVQNQSRHPHLLSPATESFNFAPEDLCVKLAGLQVAYIDQLQKEFAS